MLPSFYRLAHITSAWPSELSFARSLVERGARSVRWHLSPNVKRATSDGHPNPGLLAALARVITDGADPTELSSFPEWAAAGPAHVNGASEAPQAAIT